MKMAYGDWEEAYGLLARMFEAMKYWNPGMFTFYEPHDSKIRFVNGVSTPVFGRVFWCFGPSIEDFKHCRPVLSVDGTFLTGKFKGVLLVVISCDANN